MTYCLAKSGKDLYTGRKYRWIYSAVRLETGEIRISGEIGTRLYIFHTAKSAVTAYNAEVRAKKWRKMKWYF